MQNNAENCKKQTVTLLSVAPTPAQSAEIQREAIADFFDFVLLHDAISDLGFMFDGAICGIDDLGIDKMSLLRMSFLKQRLTELLTILHKANARNETELCKN